MPDQANVTDPIAANSPPPARFGTVRIVARVLACLVALTLLGFGAPILWEGLHFRSQCRVAEEALVCDATLDVGAPGRHVATLKQIASFPCKQYLRLEPALRADEDPQRAIEGLHIEFSIRDQHGAQVASCEMPDPYAGIAQKHALLAETFTPMAVGEYTVVIDVTSAAPALAGRPVRIVSGYVLCGIEWMSATYGIAIGAAGTIFGGSIAAALWFTRRRVTR